MPDIVGLWALHVLITSQSSVVIVGHVRSESHTFILAEVREQDGVWVQDHKVCAIDLQGGGIVGTRIPEAYVAAIEPKTYPLTLTESDGVWSYDADTLPYITGFDPACTDGLPNEPDDPCVTDWDGDGEVGATVQAKAPLFPWVDVYVAQRNRLVFHGTVSDDAIAGTLEADVNSEVLGASNRLFARSPTSEVLLEDSSFEMVRLPAGSGCEAVRAALKAE